MQIDHARLHDSAEIRCVDLEDARHPCERHHDASLDRDRAAGETRTRSAGNDRHGVLVAEPRERCDVGGALWKDDRVGRRGVDRAVVLVQKQVVVRSEHFRRTEQRDQAMHQRSAAKAGANDLGGRQDATPG